MAIYQTDERGNCVYVSDSLCRLFDLTRERALNVGWMDRIHPEDRDRVAKQRENAIGPVQTFSVRYRIVVRDEIRWVEAFSTALVRDGRFAGRSGYVREVKGPRSDVRSKAAR